jgi:hypothetical protein
MKSIVKSFVNNLINGLRSLVNNEAASYVMSIGAIVNLIIAVYFHVASAAHLIAVITFCIECVVYLCYAGIWIIGSIVDDIMTNKEFAEDRYQNEVMLLKDIASSLPTKYSYALNNIDLTKDNVKIIKNILLHFINQYKDNYDLAQKTLLCVQGLSEEDIISTLGVLIFDCESAIDNLKYLK